MSEVLTVGSLFTGFGGLDLGLEQTGRFRVVWQVEKDGYCQKVLRKHWPDVARYGDIRDLDTGTLARVDLVTGGFPCQPHSLAGKRKASEDERDLWGEYARIIRELRPRWVLAENVLGLLSSENGDFFGKVLGDLAQMGYDATWGVLSAAQFGAPHLRERVFLVAYSNSNRPQEVYAQPWLFRETPTERHCLESSHSGCIDARRPNCGRLLWEDEPDVGRVADGVPYRVERLRGLGNAVVPAVARYIGECIAFWNDYQPF